MSLRRPHHPLTPRDAQFRTSMSRRRGQEAVASVRSFESDDKIDQRMKAMECRACFYLSSRIGGQAFSEWTCGVCASDQMHSSTATPRVCSDCAREHSLCTYCGGDLEMRERRRNWPTPKLRDSTQS